MERFWIYTVRKNLENKTLAVKHQKTRRSSIFKLNLRFYWQAKEAELLRYKQGITKMEMMMKVKGSLHSSLLEKNLVEAVASMKAEKTVLKEALDAEKLSRQVAETLLKDIALERNQLRKSLANVLKDSSLKLQQLRCELETSKIRELGGMEEIRRLSSLINLERVQFQRQLHETKLFFRNSNIQGSPLASKPLQDLVDYQHILASDGQLVNLIHSPAELKERTTIMQAFTFLPTKDSKEQKMEKPESSEDLKEELEKLKEEIETLRVQARRSNELETEVAILQNQRAEAESCALEDIERKKSEISVLLEENKRLSLVLSENLQKIMSSEDAVRVKNKMLDSQNDTIRELKLTVTDLRKQLAEKALAIQSLEADFRRQLQEEVDQVHALQGEVAEQDLVISELEEELQGQKQSKTAAENAKAALQKSLVEKDDMLRYIESEIERVKDLYEGRERLVTLEKNKALENLQLLTVEKATMQSEFENLLEQKKVLEEREQKSRDELDSQGKEMSDLLLKLSSMSATLNAQSLLAQEKMKDLYNSKVNQLCKALEELRDVNV